MQEAAIGDLMGEGVLESIDRDGDQVDFVQHLGPLEPFQEVREDVLRHIGDGLEEGHRHLQPNDCCCLYERLLGPGQAGRGEPPGPPESC
jgi:hypothetical protein